MTFVRRAMLLVMTLLWAAPARAQLFESVGTRAQGMGGAFVAVADDATASWWNPAGLATGAFFNAVLEYNVMREPRYDRDATGRSVPSWEHDVRSVATAYPALGLSYYRVKVSEISAAAATATATPGRQDQGAPSLRSLVINQFGTTVGQSIGNHFVVASTLKLVRGTSAFQVASGAGATLADARALSGETKNRFDLDLGAMASLGTVRLGLAVRNVAEPSFGSGDSSIRLERQARAGLAVNSNSRQGTAAFTLSADADLTRTPTAVGDERHVAGGFEAWAPNRRIGIRAGVSASTVGEARPSASAGLSLGLRSGTYLEGQLTGGRDVARRGWGLGLRVTY
jgi:hypothetical protein